MDDYPMIELFGQHNWHCEGAIRLNRAGAAALVASLQAFLKGANQTVEVTASDGEGYCLHLIAGELHDMLKVNHYLDTPGVPSDSADNLLWKVNQHTASRDRATDE